MTVVRTRPAPTTPERSPLRELRRFVVIAFVAAWVVGGLGFLVLDLGEIGLGVGVLMVAVAALVCTRLDTGSLRPMLQQIVRWRIHPRWYAAALLSPFALLGATLLFGPSLVGRGLPADAPGPTALLLLPAYVLFMGGPEELGWRGYALPRLQARWNALAATLVLGGIWMAWHIPVLLVPSVLFEDIPVVPYVVIGVASSVVYTWLYNSTGGSILLPMLLHAAKNLSLLWLAPEAFVVYATGWVVLAVVIVVAYGATNLSRVPRHRAVPVGDATHG